MRWFRDNAVWLGWLSVWLYIGYFVLQVIFQFALMQGQREINQGIATPIENFVSTTLILLFFFGLIQFASRRGDAELSTTFRTIFVITILQIVLGVPFWFIRYFEADFLTSLLIAQIPLFCIEGILMIRLAEQCNKYILEFGGVARRVIWWSKVGGWMLASVVLLLPGLIPATFAYFFLWRLLASEVRTSKGELSKLSVSG